MILSERDARGFRRETLGRASASYVLAGRRQAASGCSTRVRGGEPGAKAPSLDGARALGQPALASTTPRQVRGRKGRQTERGNGHQGGGFSGWCGTLNQAARAMPRRRRHGRYRTPGFASTRSTTGAGRSVARWRHGFHTIARGDADGIISDDGHTRQLKRCGIGETRVAIRADRRDRAGGLRRVDHPPVRQSDADHRQFMLAPRWLRVSRPSRHRKRIEKDLGVPSFSYDFSLGSKKIPICRHSRRHLAASTRDGRIAHAGARRQAVDADHRKRRRNTVVEQTNNRNIGADAFAILWDG